MKNKNELKMLVICLKPGLRRKVRELFEKSTIKVIFSEAKNVSKTERKLLKECDLYCITQQFNEDGRIVYSVNTLPPQVSNK